MPTNASGTSAYCVGSDFTARFDYRSAAQLLVDAEPNATPLTQAQVEAHPNLAVLLSAASGEVEAACIVSDRYVIDSDQNDLTALSGNSEQYLFDIICALAAERLFRRRPDLLKEVGPQVEAAREALQLLRDGERVFGFVEHARAGVPQHHTETATDEVARRGISVQAEKLFGTRGWRRIPPPDAE